jgi:hypothetical protein
MNLRRLYVKLPKHHMMKSELKRYGGRAIHASLLIMTLPLLE